MSLLARSSQAEVVRRREETRSTRVARTRLDSFPRSRVVRWAMRIGLGLPYVAIAMWNHFAGVVPTDTPNSALMERVASLGWESIDVVWLERLYPPITTILASIVPGNRLGLSVLGGVVAGFLLQRVIEIMVQRRFPPGTLGFLLIALAANPLFAYTATENFEGILCLSLFGIGLADTVRFVAWSDTRAGFRAGLLFMGAVLSSPAGFIYVVVAVIAAPLLRLGRAHQPGARGANVLILAFPTAAALLSFAFLEWAFVGQPFAFVGYAMHDGRPFVDVITNLLTTLNGWLVLAPVLSAWVIALIVRRPWAIAISTLVFFGVVANSVLGLRSAAAAGDTFILMTLMAIALIPTARRIPTILLVDLVAVAQIAIGWLAAYNRPIVLDWLTRFTDSLPG